MNSDEIIGFSLLNIKTIQFAIFENHFDEEADVELVTKIETKYDIKNKIIGIFLHSTFEQNKIPFIKIIINCNFKVKDESWEKLLNENHTKISFDKHFLQHLGIITVGTARGVLFAKTENTKFNNFILPTIDLTDMIEENAEIEL